MIVMELSDNEFNVCSAVGSNQNSTGTSEFYTVGYVSAPDCLLSEASGVNCSTGAFREAIGIEFLSLCFNAR